MRLRGRRLSCEEVPRDLALNTRIYLVAVLHLFPSFLSNSMPGNQDKCFQPVFFLFLIYWCPQHIKAWTFRASRLSHVLAASIILGLIDGAKRLFKERSVPGYGYLWKQRHEQYSSKWPILIPDISFHRVSVQN